MRAGGNVDPPMPARLPGNGAEGRYIVGVHTDEEVVIPVPYGRQIVLQHAADDRLLPPQRHEDRDGPLGGPAQFGTRWPREADAAGRQPNQSDEQVIQPADRDPYRDRNQKSRHPAIQPLK